MRVAADADQQDVDAIRSEAIRDAFGTFCIFGAKYA
jgi:hypothetical protein